MALPITKPVEQVLIDLLRSISCKLDTVNATLKNPPQPLPGEQTIIYTHPPRSTNVNFGKLTITTTPTLLRPADANRLSISIVNSSVSSVYLGDDNNVTTNTGAYPGYELMSNAEFSSDVYVGDIYGVVAAGSVDLTYWEEVEQ